MVARVEGVVGGLREKSKGIEKFRLILNKIVMGM